MKLDQSKEFEIMTRQEVEEFLSVSYATVRRMCLRGELVAYRMGRRIYFRRSEILATMTANRVEVETEEPSQAV
jgi:excisionase family DNA binding protein